MRKALISFVFVLLIIAAGLIDQKTAKAVEPRRVEVTAKRFDFEPGVITLKKGEPVVLVLRSADVPHGIRIRELGLEIKASKEKPGEVQFTPEKDGDFAGHCSVFCGSKHGSMIFTIHVVS